MSYYTSGDCISMSLSLFEHVNPSCAITNTIEVCNLVIFITLVMPIETLQLSLQ